MAAACEPRSYEAQPSGNVAGHPDLLGTVRVPGPRPPLSDKDACSWQKTNEAIEMLTNDFWPSCDPTSNQYFWKHKLTRSFQSSWKKVLPLGKGNGWAHICCCVKLLPDVSFPHKLCPKMRSLCLQEAHMQGPWRWGLQTRVWSRRHLLS